MSKNKETNSVNWLNNIFPFLNWISELKNMKVLKYDIIAGITVAFVLIPQSMAYAQLAGLPIEVGLYTAFIPVIVAALFGSSKQMSTGPVTIISLMTATAIATVSSPTTSIEAYMVYASLLAFFIGIFYIILAILRGGVIVDFLSHPVIIGFTNAVAIITLTSQAGKIFGINYEKGDHYFEGIYNLITTAIEQVHYPTLAFGVGAIILLILLGKFAPKVPKVLIVLIVSILISDYLGFDGKMVGAIPSTMPSFNIPFLSSYVLDLKIEQIINLMVFGGIIGLIGFTESISVAKFVGTKTKQTVSVNKELIGQGLANISSSFFGGYGVAGSFSKTAVNLRAGARTGFSSVVTGIMVGITILFLTTYLKSLPMATLAAIIIVAVADLIKVKTIIKAWKTETHDGIVAVITFILTLLLTPKIEMGIVIGVTLSLALFIYRSMRPRLVEVAMYKDGVYRDKKAFNLKTSKRVSVFRFDGVLFFANAGYFESTILNFISKKEKLKYVILDLEWMPDIDATGLEVLEHLHDRLDKEIGIKVYCSSLRVKVIKKFMKSGFLKSFGKKNIFVKVGSALKRIEEKEGNDINLESLLEYNPEKKDKKNEDEENDGKDILKKYVQKK